MSEGGFAVELEILKGFCGIAQIGEDFLSHLLLNAVTNYQEAGAGESGGNQQHGEEKFGA
jgi:hypothetical protein